MHVSLLTLLSVVGVMLAGLSVTSYLVVRAWERRPHEERASSEALPEGPSNHQLSVVPYEDRREDLAEVRRSQALVPMAEFLDEALRNTLSSLSDEHHDVLVDHYKLVGIPRRRSSRRQISEPDRTIRLVEARRLFNRKLESLLERMLKDYDEGLDELRKAVDLMRGAA